MGVEQLELVGVLPSLLYSAAVNMPVIDFRRGLKTIGALSVVVALALIRTGFVVPVILTARRRRPTHEEKARRFGEMLEQVAADERFQQHPRGARIERWLQRHHADARFYAGNGLGWRGGAVIAWSGMRGVVTLAAAQSLPLDFPYRSQLVPIAFVVALVTLVAQGGTLPLLIRLLGIRGTDEEQAQRELTLLLGELREAAAVQVLENPGLRRRNGEAFDSKILRKASRFLARPMPGSGDAARPAVSEQLPELLQLLLDVQQDALNEARSIGAFDSRTIAAAQRLLDAGSAQRGID